MNKHHLTCIFLFLFSICITSNTRAQQVTGIWQGRIDKNNVEIKIIQKGDSLQGTSYYYESPAHFRRFTIKGYFDQGDNSVVWWDDQLIEDLSGPVEKGLLSVADFNCPDGGVLRLNGKASPKNRINQPQGFVNLTKGTSPTFPDEWDYVIENYTVGGNDPDIIDSIALITKKRQPKAPAIAKINKPRPVKHKNAAAPLPDISASEPVVVKNDPPPVPIEEKFITRKKVFTTDIPLEGDSIELRFYDNAEVDGDSISLFLNDRMLFTHVRLTDKPYTIKLPIQELQEVNELTMVAENLGSIPPNTSYMVALVGDKRYDAQLASTEQSSAMIRLHKGVQ